MRRFLYCHLLGAGLAAAPPAVVHAQPPSAVDFPAHPAVVGVGSAGVAAWAEAGAAAINPALLATLEGFTFEFAAFDVRRVDQRGVRAAVSFAGPFGGRYGLSFQQKGIDDLVEDPAVDEGGLEVGDAAVRLVAARAFADGTIAVAVAVSGVWSTVFETRGRAAFLDAGIAVRPHALVSLGAALRRIGPDMRWRSGAGVRSPTSLAPAGRLGVGLGRFLIGPLGILLVADVEAGPAPAGTALGFGADVAVSRLLYLRAGASRAAGAGFVWSGGFGVSVQRLRLDFAYEAAAVIGPRLHLGLVFE